ncbi:hypothetical protein V6S67_12870 [Arthrobacter sp. Soc17.1.1.1]|uniref:hypothetical protein n=1 Tax=Arthrobacter sp. Soc17.1.1.1 TaxID=3121277 RepID=UPI002FE441F6
MPHHIEEFIRQCITVTADGSLVSADEVEGLYQHWLSLRTAPTPLTSITTTDLEDLEADDDSPLLDALRSGGAGTVQNDGVEYLEGLVLTGPVVADFILSCDFAGVWGQPDPRELALIRDVASVS